MASEPAGDLDAFRIVRPEEQESSIGLFPPILLTLEEEEEEEGKDLRFTPGRYLSLAAQLRAVVVGVCTAGLREKRSLGSGC